MNKYYDVPKNKKYESYVINPDKITIEVWDITNENKKPKLITKFSLKHNEFTDRQQKNLAVTLKNSFGSSEIKVISTRVITNII